MSKPRKKLTEKEKESERKELKGIKGNFQFGRKTAKRVFALPVEQAVVVPSTSGVRIQRRISDAQLKNRVRDVRRFFIKKFGGDTSVKASGGFVSDRTGKIIKEKVVKVTSFATEEAFKKNKRKVIGQVGRWSKKWKQESIGYEHEGDFFTVKPRRRKRITPARRVVLLRNLKKARASKKR